MSQSLSAFRFNRHDVAFGRILEKLRSVGESVFKFRSIEWLIYSLKHLDQRARLEKVI